MEDLAYNLWWSWHPEARFMFRGLDPHLWSITRHNPVLFLHRLAPSILERAASDPVFLAPFDDIIGRFEAEMDVSRNDTWIALNKPELRDRTVAYFSAEF